MWLTLALIICITITFFSGIKVDTMLMKLEKEEASSASTVPPPSSSSTNRRKSNQIRHDHSDAKISTTGTGAAVVVTNATIIVQLSGEMGNNLHKLAFARGLQIQLLGRDVSTNLILRHMDGDDSKWKRARSFISRCFPKLSHLDFEAGNSQEYQDRQVQQKILYGASVEGLKLKGKDDETVTRVLDHLQSLVNDGKFSTSSVGMPKDAKIHLPFLVADEMVDHEYLDRYRNDFRTFFDFDDDACCAAIPEPDESVFHFRNFRQELKGVTKQRGFRELNPQQVATELFGQLQDGDKVAIVSRFKNDITKQYVTALEDRNLNVRLISGQTPVEDFCFLKRAKKEMVGTEISSFFVWAAYLSTAPVQSYFVADNRQAGKKSAYPWNDPDPDNSGSAFRQFVILYWTTRSRYLYRHILPIFEFQNFK